MVRWNKKNISLKAYNNVLKIVISGVISMIMNFLLKIFNVMHYYYLCGKNLPTCNRQMDQQTDGKSRLRGYEQGGRPMPYRWAWEVLQEGRGSYMGGCGLFTTRLDRAAILMHAFTRSLVNSFADLLVCAARLLVHLIAFSCPHLHSSHASF